MGTMIGGFCLHYDCSNRNSFGYCKTTVCINEHYQQEQWGLQSTTPWFRCNNCKWASCKDCCLDWLKQEAEE